MLEAGNNAIDIVEEELKDQGTAFLETRAPTCSRSSTSRPASSS